MATNTQPTKAWADETDEDDGPRNTVVNAWAKGNPLVANVPTNNHTAHVDDEYYDNEPQQTSKPYQSTNNYSRDDKYDDRQREERRGYSQYSEDRNYDRRPREDYSYNSRGRGSGNRDDYQSRDNGRRQTYGGEGRGYRESREQKEPVPFPTSPPYTAFVGNLPYDVTKEELEGFFRGSCLVHNVRLLYNRETNRQKGFGYVEFEDLESLKQAVQLNGETLIDRPLRIDVAEAKPEDRQSSWGGRNDRGRGEGSDRGGRFNNRSYGSGFGERDRRPEDRERKEDRDRKPDDRDPQSPLDRPKKLEIKPRSSASVVLEASDAYGKAKVNPFGNAKPRDENLFQKKKEEERKKERRRSC